MLRKTVKVFEINFLLTLILFRLQIRTGLSSEKLFPLEELFYKHGKNKMHLCFSSLNVLPFSLKPATHLAILYAAMSVENRGNGHTWRMLANLIADI